MNEPVKLSGIIDAMDSQSDETNAYLNKETGEIVLVSEEEFSAAEEKRPPGVICRMAARSHS